MSTKTSNRVFVILCLLLAVVIGILYVPHAVQSHTEENVIEINDWFYTDENGEKVDITLPHKLYQDSNGDIEIKTYLSEEIKEGNVICFWTFYQSVEVYIEDKLIYLFDNSGGGSFGEAASSQWNFVDIDEENPEGKLLTLRMHTPYSDINLRLTEVMCGESYEIHKWLNRTYNIFRLFELLFIAIGIIMIVLMIFQKMDKKTKLNQFYSGVVFIVFSLYLRTGTKGLPIYWLSNYTREFLCFFFLLFLSVPFTLYIRSRVTENRKMVIWCDILIVTEFLLGIGDFILHGIGIVDIHRTMAFSVLLLVVASITALCFSAYYVAKKKTKIALAALINSIIIFVCIFFEYLQFYQLSTLPFDTGVLSHLGALVVIIVENTVQIVVLSREVKTRSEVETENISLQFQLLTDQIRPHFLLNTVGAIRNLIHEDPDRASDLLYEFSKYFRKNFERKDYTKPIPFPQEMDYIATYLELEKARFGDRIDIEYDLSVKEFWVLPLTIQPFVENSVKHGLSSASCMQDDGSKGVLRISTNKLKNSVEVLIEDNGVGFDVDSVIRTLPEKSSVGLKSAIMRLETGLGATVRIKSSTASHKSGTVVRIEIPDRRIKEK